MPMPNGNHQGFLTAHRECQEMEKGNPHCHSLRACSGLDHVPSNKDISALFGDAKSKCVVPFLPVALLDFGPNLDR